MLNTKRLVKYSIVSGVLVLAVAFAFMGHGKWAFWLAIANLGLIKLLRDDQ